MSAETDVDSELERLESWRLLCLLNVGWAQHRAELIAARQDVDLHLAVHIVELGCDQHLALKILL